MADKCWYTLDAASKPVGPYSIADLTGYAKSGYVSESQLFWKEGKASWDKLAAVLELEAVLKAAREFKPPAAAASAAGAPQPQPQPQPHPHVKVITAKPSDPLEAFKHEIAAVEAGEAVDETAAAVDAADDDRQQTPDELEFEDDDGTLYRWNHKLRKYIPAAEADAAAAADGDGAAAAAARPNDPHQQQQQQQQQQDDYDMDAMTFVQEEEFVPTLAAARAADEAAAAAAGKDAGKWDNKRPADADATGQNSKKAKTNKQGTAAAAAAADETAAAAPAAAAEDPSAAEAAATKQNEDQPKGWFDLQVNTSVYVTGLPDDTDNDEVAGIFAKCGIIKLDDEGKPKVKLYRDRQSGMLKGDGLVTYLKEPSVDLACQILDGDSLRPGGPPMSVTVAKFEMKGGKYQDRKKTGGQNNKGKGKGKRKPLTQQEKLERKLGWYGFDDVLPPEKVTVVLKHMFTPEEAAAGGSEFATELEADVLAEATKLGVVEKVRVYAAHPDGVVTVKFKQEEPAQACVAKMNGRFFGGRQLVAHMWDGFTYYHVKVQKTETPEEEAARLEAFARELEQQQAADAAPAAAAAAPAAASVDAVSVEVANGDQQ